MESEIVGSHTVVGLPEEHILFQPTDLTGQVGLLSSTPKFLGTYSFVYQGHLRGELVAAKVLRLVTDNMASMKRKFRRELEVWATLNHNNIMPFYGFSNDPIFGELGALISPWYPAGDANEFLKRNARSMSFRDRIGFWKGIIEGVNYLHTRTPSLVHGDLKPGNVLVDRHGRPRICDFGLVRILLNEASTGMTTTSEHTGTDRYLAIELLNEDTMLPTTASDIHALGCLGLDVMFSLKPHAQRKHNLRGGVIQDIKRGLPPASRDDNLEIKQGRAVDVLDSLQNTAWTLLELCWRLEPGSRPAAQQLLTWIDAVLSATRAIEDYSGVEELTNGVEIGYSIYA